LKVTLQIGVSWQLERGVKRSKFSDVCSGLLKENQKEKQNGCKRSGVLRGTEVRLEIELADSILAAGDDS